MKKIEFFIASDNKPFLNEAECLSYENTLTIEEKPYKYKFNLSLTKLLDVEFNPNYNEDQECKCGHPYYRHFDPYEDMAPVGCKYCGCGCFEEK